MTSTVLQAQRQVPEPDALRAPRRIRGLEPLLDPGETLLWTGRPLPLPQPIPLLVTLMTLTILWYSLRVIMGDLRDTVEHPNLEPTLDVLTSTATVLAALSSYWLIATAPDWLRVLGTRYVVTDRRAIIVALWPTRLAWDHPIGPGTALAVHRGRWTSDLAFDLDLGKRRSGEGEAPVPFEFTGVAHADAAIAAVAASRRRTE